MRLVPKFPIAVFNIKKVPWKWLLVSLLILALGLGGFYLYEEVTQPDPQEAVKQGLVKTLGAKSYRYEAIAKRTLEGKESVLSQVVGEKNHQSVHIKGELPVIKAEVEIYQIGDTMYRRDTTSKGWLKVPAKGRVAFEQLIAEINPLGSFNFSQIIEVKYAGKEKIGGKTCRVYEVMARGENKFLELYWQDFNYKLWIDRNEGIIRKAEVSAEHRSNSQHLLNISILLSDFNENIEIKEPKVGQ
ncbi:hypothetical protein BR63_09605 [Thermanaerosceptrum fracticalcis]|uniref:Uncharacterized protein n=1 Tax=Thermanaerosceptrum fracticalcis TaxID=1712410 RepID=A0A7G6E389_THEFR|nr:hypothetical protein [Thermanaerosceptrum fracticalcis]QNB46543.1 hypothetical protein BR63_09605 [Thermanaerosceptrum fracticalcis]